MNDVKKQFLDYLRGVYGADSTVMSQPMPPIETGPNYPAFNSVNRNLGMMAQSAGGMRQPQFSRLENRRPQVGGPRDELQSAQDILLGG